MTISPLRARHAARTRQAWVLFTICCFMLAILASISILPARADGGGVPTNTPFPTPSPTVLFIITPPPAIREVTVVIPAQGDAALTAPEQRTDQKSDQGLMAGQPASSTKSKGTSRSMGVVAAVVGVMGLVIVINFLVRKLRRSS